MEMTIEGFLLWLCISVVGTLISLGFGYTIDTKRSLLISKLIGIAISLLTLVGMIWWFNSTASGARALKSQRSNFHNGINRVVTVYDVNGQIIKEYKGKFDLEYDDDRILFDDDEGLRHVIYYPTGTVTVDEIK
jgi:hypothetical protein